MRRAHSYHSVASRTKSRCSRNLLTPRRPHPAVVCLRDEKSGEWLGRGASLRWTSTHPRLQFPSELKTRRVVSETLHHPSPVSGTKLVIKPTIVHYTGTYTVTGRGPDKGVESLLRLPGLSETPEG